MNLLPAGEGSLTTCHKKKKNNTPNCCARSLVCRDRARKPTGWNCPLPRFGGNSKSKSFKAAEGLRDFERE